MYGLQRALYDGLAMAFLTQLHPDSVLVLESLLKKSVLGSMGPKDFKVILVIPLLSMISERTAKRTTPRQFWREHP